jgi:hypothetical protein
VIDVREVVASTVHDLAGIVTNLQAFSGILEGSPDHPSRAEFAAVLARESRAAVQAVKDLQLAAEISAENFGGRATAVGLTDLIRSAAREAEADPTGDPVSNRELRVSPDIMSLLLSRSLMLARGGDGRWPLKVTEGDGEIELLIDLSSTVYEGDVARDFTQGRKELRPATLLAAAAQRWGARAELLDGPTLSLTFGTTPQNSAS